MSTSKIVIVDYGTGNLNSIKRTLGRMSVDCTITSSAEEIIGAEKIILPGVGHFGTAMSNLNRLGLIGGLNESVLQKRKPILGICLGMELMAQSSEEGGASGLGWLDASTVRFDVQADQYKVPHMGWNTITLRKPSRLTEGIDEGAEFYFAHSYHLRLNDVTDLLTETDYGGGGFPSAIQKGNVFGVQFHPEKSHEAGARLLKNFVEM